MSNRNILRVLIIGLLIICVYFIYNNIRINSIIANQEKSVDSLSGKYKLTLNENELKYLKNTPNIRMGVDPDWEPYEKINISGDHEGIAADLIKIISSRVGIKIDLVKTKDWTQTIEYSKNGEIDIISFLNKSTEREKWLIFTETYFEDPNVIITREEHDYVSDLSSLKDEKIALPEGTSVEERIRKEFKNLKVIIVPSERDAIDMVSSKKCDLTIRSLTMAAYTIKSRGLFNLKISGQIPSYTNKFRIGLAKDNTLLQNILNKGIATLTPQEVQAVVNKHIPIKIDGIMDYKTIFGISFVFVIISTLIIYWNNRLRILNKKLSELTKELEIKNKLLNDNMIVDKLTGINNRLFFDKRISEEIELANRYKVDLSLLLIDLDKFKLVNDNYGHDIGDEVLKSTCSTINEFIRKTDIFVRWGGEEFAIILPNTNRVAAMEVGEKIRSAIEKLVHPKAGQVTISIGVAQLLENEYMESWFKRTDQSLYKAKLNGRNRVCSIEEYELNRPVLVKLNWNDNWKSGNDLIDEDHKKLLDLGNKLIENSLKDDLASNALNHYESLINFVDIHFKSEEEYIKSVRLDLYEEHKAEHNKLLMKAIEVKRGFQEGSIDSNLLFEFLVNDIIHNHLLKEDIKFFKV